MSKLAKALTAAAGNAGAGALYVEDVFSTYLYDGNGSTQTISNGINIGSYPIIDLNNEGYAIGVNQTQVYNHTHSNLKAGDFVIVFNLITASSSPTCTINGTTASILTQLENDPSYSYSYTIYTYQVGAGESSAAISVSYGLGITTSLVVRGPTSVNLEQAMAQQTGSAAFGNNSTTGYTLNFVVDREPNANFTASATKEIIDTSYTYFAFDAWSQSGNGTSVPAFTATDSVSDSSAGAFASISFEGDGSDALSSSNGEGGLVWTKNRDNAFNNFLYDTERGATNYLISDSTIDQQTVATSLTSFNSNGFTLGANDYGNIVSGAAAVSWTFRKAEKFFDVVTYTGDGSVSKQIAHNLGVAPAIMIVKDLTSSNAWNMYSSARGNTKVLFLNSNAAEVTSDAWWYSTTPTSTEFTVGYNASVNTSGSSYVAYLFASDAGGFGDDENIIKCGSYTGTGSAGLDIDLGFEPQWILIKNVGGGHSAIYDVMRQKYLAADLTNAESAFWSYPSPPIMPRATGITIDDTNVTVNASGNTYIYIAIRRPMKTPESGTEVFAIDGLANGTAPDPWFISNFVTDMTFVKQPSAATGWLLGSRLTGTGFMATNSTAAESDQSNQNWDYMNGVYDATANNSYLSWMFKRATGFFDVVAYTGDGTGAKAIPHNLGVVPEWVIFKRRENSENWYNYHDKNLSPNANWWLNYLILDNSNATASSSSFDEPNNANINLASNNFFNGSGKEYIVYLFATLAGVSKVGSYTGTGSFMDIDCGFSAGARFILIKRTDSTGDWYVWDSARGIVAGNDPYLLLNSTAAEVTSTDYIDPLSSGFRITTAGAEGPLGASGGNYIFLAIA
jgi:hypothetical protein